MQSHFVFQTLFSSSDSSNSSSNSSSSSSNSVKSIAALDFLEYSNDHSDLSLVDVLMAASHHSSFETPSYHLHPFHVKSSPGFSSTYPPASAAPSFASATPTPSSCSTAHSLYASSEECFFGVSPAATDLAPARPIFFPGDVGDVSSSFGNASDASILLSLPWLHALPPLSAVRAVPTVPAAAPAPATLHRPGAQPSCDYRTSSASPDSPSAADGSASKRLYRHELVTLYKRKNDAPSTNTRGKKAAREDLKRQNNMITPCPFCMSTVGKEKELCRRTFNREVEAICTKYASKAGGAAMPREEIETRLMLVAGQKNIRGSAARLAVYFGDFSEQVASCFLFSVEDFITASVSHFEDYQVFFCLRKKLISPESSSDSEAYQYYLRFLQNLKSDLGCGLVQEEVFKTFVSYFYPEVRVSKKSLAGETKD